MGIAVMMRVFHKLGMDDVVVAASEEILAEMPASEEAYNFLKAKFGKGKEAEGPGPLDP